MGNFSIDLLILLFLHQMRATLNIQNENNNGYRQNAKAQHAIDCDSTSGWECDYEPEFSHRNGDHSFCDLDIISLDDKLIGKIFSNHLTIKFFSLLVFSVQIKRIPQEVLF